MKAVWGRLSGETQASKRLGFLENLGQDIACMDNMNSHAPECNNRSIFA